MNPGWCGRVWALLTPPLFRLEASLNSGYKSDNFNQMVRFCLFVFCLWPMNSIENSGDDDDDDDSDDVYLLSLTNTLGVSALPQESMAVNIRDFHVKLLRKSKL